jgi:hypothetical protein
LLVNVPGNKRFDLELCIEKMYTSDLSIDCAEKQLISNTEIISEAKPYPLTVPIYGKRKYGESVNKKIFNLLRRNLIRDWITG